LKRILYLSFYFEPDLCAGSFRNSPLANELASQMSVDDELIVITTKPNRYSTFKVEAKSFEKVGNISVYRIDIPAHNSGFVDQIFSFKTFYLGVKKIFKSLGHFDLVFASSSRLFTAYLGYKAANYLKAPLYLDVRDIFADTMKDVLRNPVLKFFTLPLIYWIERKTFSNATHINLISEGFKPYFEKYPNPNYSYYTNGIDDAFLGLSESKENNNTIKRILYAGNLGEGQGLHTIIPFAAKGLGAGFEFLVIGDGGAKSKLKSEIEHLGVKNVTLLDPVKRDELKLLYEQCDYFFLHLNNYEAFKKVLPSKIFELGAYDKPIIAGVGGFANKFINDNLSNVILFEPSDFNSMIEQLKSYTYTREIRYDFINKFKRSNLNMEMASNILKYIK